MAKYDERVIEQYAGLAGELNRMNKEAPEIFAMYQETRELLGKEQDAINRGRDELKRQNAEAKKLVKTLQQKIAEADELKAEYQKSLAASQKAANSLYEEMKAELAEIKKIQWEIRSAEPLLSVTLDELTGVFDYAETDTVAAMYRKYSGKAPVVVRRPNWTVDQAFLVVSVQGNRVDGVAFQNGAPAPNGARPRADSQCRIFCGPSQRGIFRFAFEHRYFERK